MATVANRQNSDQDEQGPPRKSQRVIKRKFILDKGRVKPIELSSNGNVERDAHKLVNPVKCTEVKVKRVDLPQNKTPVKLNVHNGKFTLQAECEIPADLIDLSVDKQEEREFLSEMDELDLDQLDDEALEAGGQVTPVQQPPRSEVTDTHTSITFLSENKLPNSGRGKINAEGDFDQLLGNPAFERYLQKRMSEEQAKQSDNGQGQGHHNNKATVTVATAPQGYP